jgi:hypothetical protein
LTEIAVRDLMRRAMAGYEPPIGPVLGKALRAARRARRQRLAASIAAATVIAACLVVGVAVVGEQAHGAQRRGLASVDLVFIRPSLPYVTYIPIHPLTSEYFGQLLVAQLPPDAGYGQVMASANSNVPGATGRTASAYLDDVTTSVGSGAVKVEMMAVGATDAQFGCAPGLAAGHCHAYTLAGGVKVIEEYASAALATGRQQVLSFQVQVFRPRVALVSLSESNRAATAGSPVARAMPILAAQLLTAALDPRWQFYITRPVESQAGSGRGMPM